MSWDRAKAEDKLRRLLGACQTPETAVKWAPHLANFCEEISAMGAGARPRRQAEILLVLLEAGPFFAARGQVRDFLRWVDPLLQKPSKQLLDDVYLLVSETILQSGAWGSIGEAVEDLKRYTVQRDDVRFWVAYSKMLTSVINALYSMNRFSTGDTFHAHFDAVPARHRSVTRFYESQALLEMAMAHARAGDGAKVQRSVELLKAKYEEQPRPAMRRNYAAGIVAMIPELMSEGKLSRCEEWGEVLFKLVSGYPEDVELGGEYLRFVAVVLPVFLEFNLSEIPLQRMRTLLETFKDADVLAETVSEIVLALAESQPERAAASQELLAPTVEFLDRRFSRRSPTAAERLAQVRRILGMPDRSAGCLGVVLVTLALVAAT